VDGGSPYLQVKYISHHKQESHFNIQQGNKLGKISTYEMKEIKRLVYINDPHGI